ncbi:Na+/H+ antiporter, partial [Escherichia marmotae]|nr:Na+/H+ antiporter [Escherichia marmotae]
LGEDMASEARAQERLASELRLVGIQAERARLLELGRARAIGSETARKLTRELDLAETRHRG